MVVTIGNSSIGGLTLGACVFYYRLFYGQVLGISGFFSKTLTPLEKSDKQISANLFIGGLVASSLIVGSVSVPMIELPLSRMALAGLLVGFGTKLGSGCTSGHGLCGLSRMSPRSWISVPLFMFSGMVVRMLTMDSYFTRDSPPFSFDVSSTGLFALALVVSIIPVTYQLSKTLKKAHKGLTVQQTLSPFFGLVFGTALIVSGMTQNQKVFDFLSFPTLFLTAPSGFVPRFDPSLALVMGFGMLPNLLVHNYLTEHHNEPLLFKESSLPTSKTVDRKLLIGSLVFGAGWGLAGVCPGPGLVILLPRVISGEFEMVPWILAYYLGDIVARRVSKWMD